MNQSDYKDIFEKEYIIDPRAVIIGVVIFVFLIIVAAIWRINISGGILEPLKEFQFTPHPPDTKEFELKEPLRELLKERYERPEVEESANIQITTELRDQDIKEEFIRSQNIEISDLDLSIKKLDIIEAPENVAEISDETAYSIEPIAVEIPDGGDILKLQEPIPRKVVKVGLVNRGPRPGKGLKFVPHQFGRVDVSGVGELGPVDINLLGSGDYLGALGRSGLIVYTAVDAALKWLALHQETEGFWDPHKWDDETVDFKSAVANKKGRGTEKAATSLALLAFMGGGHTLRKGEYRHNVIRGFKWLIEQQDPRTGAISKNMYEQAIATIALCECFGRSPDEQVGLAARKAVDYLVKAQAVDHGWRYTPNPPESDMSVTGWVMQALKTAKLADIKFDHNVFVQGLIFVDQLTDKGASSESSGGVGYMYQKDLNYGRGHRALTCAAMVIRQFSGIGVKSPVLIAGANLTQKDPPDWNDKDFYYWYYATYAMYNMGGEFRLWWNKRIRDVLLDHQSKHGHQTGSWNPEKDKWEMGRVICTSLGALCLEVYYRYNEALQSFGIAPEFEDIFFQ